MAVYVTTKALGDYFVWLAQFVHSNQDASGGFNAEHWNQGGLINVFGLDAWVFSQL
jgi:hypothetical protein